jgi:predicted aspartyl protease
MKRLLTTVTLVLGLTTPAAAQLYQWTDAEGTQHYTSDPATIPPMHFARMLRAPQARRDPDGPPAAAAGAAVIPLSGNGPIMVTALLNGVPLRLILDTGADRTVISPTAIARAGFVDEASRPINIVGVAGSAPATLLTVPQIDVAGTRLGPLPVVVHAIASEHADGLLGRDVLDSFTLTVDSASGQATLTPR